MGVLEATMTSCSNADPNYGDEKILGIIRAAMERHPPFGKVSITVTYVDDVSRRVETAIEESHLIKGEA